MRPTPEITTLRRELIDLLFVGELGSLGGGINKAREHTPTASHPHEKHLFDEEERD